MSSYYIDEDDEYDRRRIERREDEELASIVEVHCPEAFEPDHPA